MNRIKTIKSLKSTIKKPKRSKGKFRSLFEKDISENSNVVDNNIEYETEKLPYILECVYTPDFIIKGKTKNIYVESKGFFKASDRRKMLEVIKQHPDKDIRMLFQDSLVTISKASKTTYRKWCDNNNIMYSEGKKIPKKWILEANCGEEYGKES